MNMLDLEARKDLELRLREFFGPLGLNQFIIIGFNNDGQSYTVTVGFVLPPEVLRSLFRAIAEWMEDTPGFTLEDG